MVRMDNEKSQKYCSIYDCDVGEGVDLSCVDLIAVQKCLGGWVRVFFDDLSGGVGASDMRWLELRRENYASNRRRLIC